MQQIFDALQALLGGVLRLALWALMAVLALFMLMNIVAFWWASFHWYRTLETFSIAAFLPDVALFFLLFLAVAAVLPDEIPEGRFSLEEFYWREAPYFWTLNILTVILIILHLGPRNNPGDWRGFLIGEAENMFFVVIMIGLLVTRRAWYHYTVIAMILVMVGGDYLVETIKA